MRKVQCLSLLGLAGWLGIAPAALGQARPYIGYAYPAGGQQGTTCQIRLGGQGLDDVNAVLISGAGATGKVVECFRRLNNQEVQLLAEQLKVLRQATSAPAAAMAPMMKADAAMMTSDNVMMMSATTADKKSEGSGKDETAQALMARIEKRTREFVQTPACGSIASLVMAEITLASDARPGPREIRLATPRGVSNPLVFHVGQLPEYARKPMITASLQVLGKEAQSLRKRPTNEMEVRISLPCTVNGQIASGEVNRYRFEARQGQRLVITTQGRQLIPFIADAVPGWFQPVLALYDTKGKELAFDDDFRFKPDPVILFKVPRDAAYVLAIHDSIYRGREDFVYRITLGELPFVTSIFPLGGQMGAAPTPKMKGWNLQDAALRPPDPGAGPGVQTLTAERQGLVSNPVPFALAEWPEAADQETNNTLTTAQKITLPVVVNGRVTSADDWDVYQFQGKSNDAVAVEVEARRLDSPLDSVIKLTDGQGRLLAVNDDREDQAAGVNTHHADSYLLARLPADGAYYVQIGDTARKGGEEYGYRLRISPPQPDFALRVVPSSVSLRTNSTAPLTLYAQRKDGFSGPIKLALKDPPVGFSAAPVTLLGTQVVARLTVKSGPAVSKEAVSLSVVGSAKINGRETVHAAVPAEDRMQAFLWRHLVPATDLKALVFDPGYQPPPKRAVPVRPPSTPATNALAGTNAPALTNLPAVAKAASTNTSPAPNTTTATNVVAAAKPKFTKQQIAGRLRQLKLLFEEGLLTEDFYCDKVAECEAAQ